ncbi:MAG: D-alanyl-D-alanine carboxypeptidase family protein [Clostridia bacterium]|nr:D-alanyl-D-alanine carboxypeptidase family protein [Clostridia bacterium]
MKKGVRFFLFLIIITMQVTAFASFQPSAQPLSYVLMDYDTGTLLVESNGNESLPIASVTKVMTMLLCMEALQSGKISIDDIVTASEYACSMGGSQIYLEPGEQMSVNDLIKSVAVGSANDASVVLAEHIMGSESAFVDAMNDRAKSLGMMNTHFMNCNGLDEDNHYSSALDVAIMSRELIKHNAIRPFLSIWMDSVRNGEFGLTNTNKLIRFYDGAIGIKTGSTSNAKYCLSAAATRNGLTLIGVVLGAETTGERFETAKELLNYGFSNYKVETVVDKGVSYGEVDVIKGKNVTANVITESSFKKLRNKNSNEKFELKKTMNDKIIAPVKAGDVLGKIEIFENNKKIGEVNLVAEQGVLRLGFADVFTNILGKWLLK